MPTVVPGQHLGPYEIVSLLGEGGMGVVYKARDNRLKRNVAIKVLPPDKIAEPGRKQRFIQEARSASALNHPNIVTVHDICSIDGLDLIVMEHVEGHTLDELTRRNGLTPRRTLRYAIQIADAMSKAHAAGILHRDLKPSNIMTTSDDHVKVLDFGLAKLVQSPEESNDGSTLTIPALTDEGTVLGTTPYMSPEQIEGRSLDARSDIFSFGSVLYEMATGRRPFTADGRIALMTKILNEDPKPPGRLSSEVSPELERTILRCLRKDRARRYQTMADLKVALEDLEIESSNSAPLSAASPLRRRKWIPAGLLALGIAGAFAWREWRAAAPAVPLKAVALAALPGPELHPSLSPDGNYVAFTWTGSRQDNTDVYVQLIGSGSPLRLTTDPARDETPVWSPDGRWIAFLRQGESKLEVRLVPPLGGAERLVTEIRARHSEAFVRRSTLSWSPSGDSVIVTDSTGEGKPEALFAVGIESRERKQITHPPPQVFGDSNPAPAPDGGSIVFRRNTGPNNGELYWLRLKGDLSPEGEPVRLTHGSLNALHPAWLPDSKEILYSAQGNLWRLEVPGQRSPARLPFVGEDGVMPAISRAKPGSPQRLVYVRRFNDRNIWRIDLAEAGVPAASSPVLVISSTRMDAAPELSPDGTKIAFQSDRTGTSQIWLADRDGSNAVQLTAMDGLNRDGRWSPDGRTIVFCSNEEGQFELYTVDVSGGKPHRLTSHPSNDMLPSFSRDGRWIYFTSDRTGEYRIWKLPAAGGDPIQVTQNAGTTAFETIDGKELYYTDNAGMSISSLWHMPIAGGQPVKAVDRLFYRSFAMTRSGIYFMDRNATEDWLMHYDFRTAKSTPIVKNIGTAAATTATPDGRTIFFTRTDSSVDDLMLVENFR